MIFDPNHPENVGKFAGTTMLKQPRMPLGSVPRFYGSGVYAIYYIGGFPAYLPISGTETPIYVGKADPFIFDAQTPQEQGDRLYGRLNREHARSILQAEQYSQNTCTNNFIQVIDFECRYLVVRGMWPVTAKSYLTRLFRPIWNDEVGICHGFGKHGDAPTKRSGPTRDLPGTPSIRDVSGRPARAIPPTP